MPLNLVKLCVGIESVEQLEQYRDEQRRRFDAAGVEPVSTHRTRSFPRRAAEILEGGSLYWVIKGQVRARQRILRLDEIESEDGKPRCGIVMDLDVVRVMPRRHRAFQGWRYLEEADAPQDLFQADGESDAEMPPEMQEELRRLGIL
ncbi:DUF1489 domain-containing protein [Nisaea acidiphila]|uniref:DUF1489 domain-containing protein n=1 Tax=Nisaea acidiphila TaxID=1862145 RepID=A0A9J7AT81_9PROT|nr:DUF1489 domain-containing protein [Nisaea acidiphila]UUX50899.1 DUF1489 domain-containing protein [Nisaea acidiphila]